MSANHRRLRRPAAFVRSAFILAVMMACSLATCNAGSRQLILCAVDAPQGDCASADLAHSPPIIVTGDFRPLRQAQTIRLRAVDTDGKSGLANATITLTITHQSTQPALPSTTVPGCATTISQPQTVSVTLTSGADGTTQYTYCSVQSGTDTITAQFVTGTASKPAARPLVVHWISPPTARAVHPMIVLHGLNENAQSYLNAINLDPIGPKEWTTVFEALETVYDPSYIEAFCYLDDQAYPTTGCPAPEPSFCSLTPCTSQSSIDANAVELADTVIALYKRAATAVGPQTRVTLMGYSMGAAITRTMIAGCPNSPPIDFDGDGVNDCQEATGLVDQAFFFNGAQQGSWLLSVNQSLGDPSGLAGTDLLSPTPPSGPVAPIFTALSPFASITPVLQLAILALVKHTINLDLGSAAVKDLTPLSQNIQQRNPISLNDSPQSNIQFYNFYGAAQVTFSTSLFIYTVPGKKVLPLGDLVLLPQDDRAAAIPLWGGAAFCDDGNCQTPPGSPSPKLAYYSQDASGRFHEWALVDPHNVNVDLLAPLLSAPDDIASFRAALSSPVWHLGIIAPSATAPGGPSATQVFDITGREPGATTDMPTEILDILMKNDGIA
jgi:pimeloyl-ACP methyl ester carboxylesterase